MFRLRYPISNFRLPISDSGFGISDLRFPIGNRPSAIGNPSAFTLIESVVAIAIVGVMISAALAAIGAAAGAQKIGIKKRQAVQLANDLLAEIAQYPYADPDANLFGLELNEVGAQRAAFDDVDDYNNYSESPPKSRDGTALSGFTGWTREVTVQYCNNIDLSTVGTDQGLKKIRVLVTDPNGATTSLYTLRSSYTPRETEPDVYTTYVGSVTIELQAGSSGSRIVSAATPLNLVPQ